MNKKRLLNTLDKVCRAEQQEFFQYGEIERQSETDWYVYKDNGAKILGVAHLDTAIPFQWCAKDAVKEIIVCSSLDDRLGAHVLLNILPKHLNFDLLLTTNEERGMSTAQYFKPPEGKQYNWCFSFDRRGMDVVMYQYDTPELRELLKSYGFTIAQGSFSDIASLDHLGVSCFNIGVGYHNEHSYGCYANLKHTKKQVELFIPFAQANADEKLIYTPKTYKYSGYSGYGNYDRVWTGNKSVAPYSSTLQDKYDYEDHIYGYEMNGATSSANAEMLEEGFWNEEAKDYAELKCDECKHWTKVSHLSGVSVRTLDGNFHNVAWCENCVETQGAVCLICTKIFRDRLVVQGKCPDCTEAMLEFKDVIIEEDEIICPYCTMPTKKTEMTKFNMCVYCKDLIIKQGTNNQKWATLSSMHKEIKKGL